MNRFERDQKKRELKVKMMKMLEDKIEELDETFAYMVDDLAAELDLGPSGDERLDEARFQEYEALEDDVVHQAKKQFGEKLMGGTIWAIYSHHPEHGIHVEFFDERPHTADGDRRNWPKWFRVYEGDINGGDSILVDRRGRNFSD